MATIFLPFLANAAGPTAEPDIFLARYCCLLNSWSLDVGAISTLNTNKNRQTNTNHGGSNPLLGSCGEMGMERCIWACRRHLSLLGCVAVWKAAFGFHPTIDLSRNWISLFAAHFSFFQLIGVQNSVVHEFPCFLWYNLWSFGLFLFLDPPSV